MSKVQADLKLLQANLSKEKQRYYNLFASYKKILGSQTTNKSELDVAQLEDHDKLQTTKLLDEDAMTELTNLQLKMEDISASLENIEVICEYWMKQVHNDMHNISALVNISMKFFFFANMYIT